MKVVRLFAVSAIFAAVFAISAFAQTAAAGKIGLINTQAFDDDKAGITKYVAALNSLDAEFKPIQTELQTLATRIQTLQKEIQTMQGQNPVPPTIGAKAEEHDKLVREYKFKEEDAKARFQRREAAVLGPIRKDIGNAIQEYTKKNGFVIMLDVAKLDQGSLLLGMDETADITKAFITFYNARPATAAVVPK